MATYCETHPVLINTFLQHRSKLETHLCYNIHKDDSEYRLLEQISICGTYSNHGSCSDKISVIIGTCRELVRILPPVKIKYIQNVAKNPVLNSFARIPFLLVQTRQQIFEIFNSIVNCAKCAIGFTHKGYCLSIFIVFSSSKNKKCVAQLFHHHHHLSTYCINQITTRLQ